MLPAKMKENKSMINVNFHLNEPTKQQINQRFQFSDTHLTMMPESVLSIEIHCDSVHFVIPISMQQLRLLVTKNTVPHRKVANFL